MTADNHIQLTRWQVARQSNITRSVHTMLTVLVVTHVRYCDDKIRLLFFLQLSDHFLRFFFRIAEVDTTDVFWVTNFRGVFGG
ncbi:Uncharacterised protein [Vibrio cholerae]|nr:Uncharacterised protein [Vibrio cholerae]CSC87082.1 Uncharacterised protein [Vibrio cholerae]